jgi:hypothetical protein
MMTTAHVLASAALGLRGLRRNLRMSLAIVAILSIAGSASMAAGVATAWRAVFPGGAVVDVSMLAITLGVVVVTVSGACGLASWRSARRVEIAATLQRLEV